MTYSLPKFTYDEIKKLNPNFDFEGYKLVEGRITVTNKL